MPKQPLDKPFAHIRGWSEFYKLRFKVTPDVLIPRPETELLVDWILQLDPSTVLDLGTGSGNIAISLAKNAPPIKITASDISAKALKVARQNAKLNGVEESINFIQADLLDVVGGASGGPPSSDRNEVRTSDEHSSHLRAGGGERQDPQHLRRSILVPEVLVANLPYIPSSRIPKLDSSVKDFEPLLALDGGKDGFELYRKLFIQMIQNNFFPKVILAEIDETQSLIATKESTKFFPRAKVDIKRDLTKRIRFLYIQLRD